MPGTIAVGFGAVHPGFHSDIQHWLSLDVGSIVGVVGLSLELNDGSLDSSEFNSRKRTMA